MNDGKKMRSSAELPAHKRFEKSRSRWIYPSFQNTVFVFCGDWGSAPTSMKQAGPVWTESACFRKVGTALHCLPLSCPRPYPRIPPSTHTTIRTGRFGQISEYFFKKYRFYP